MENFFIQYNSTKDVTRMTVGELQNWQNIVNVNYELNYGCVKHDKYFIELPPNLKRSLLKYLTHIESKFFYQLFN